MMEKEQRLLYLPPDEISPCPYQTRSVYKRSEMERLIQSIEENGILQPLSVTETADGYELIAGHRRLFAAKMLGLIKIPVVVCSASREEVAVLCTVENIHREDLNFFDKASAIKLLCEQFGMTQTQVGQKLCLSQSAVANKLRLLQIEEDLRKIILKNELTERHARALCRLPKEKQGKALEHIIRCKLNVAQTESYIESLLTPKKPKGKKIIRFKDIRIFTNTITNALKIMKKAGFNPSFEQTDGEEVIEYKITIPLKR